MKKTLFLLVMFAIMQLSVSTQLWADTYTYTGSSFTQVYGPEGYTTSDYLRGSFTTPTPLSPGRGYNYLDYPGSGFFDLPTFSFTDGHQTIDGSNVTNGFFDFELDSTGQITTWSFVVSNNNGVFGSCSSVLPWFTCTPTPMDFTYDFTTNSGGNVPSNPGVWTAGSVPEPGSVVLLTLGVLIFRKKLIARQ